MHHTSFMRRGSIAAVLAIGFTIVAGLPAFAIAPIGDDSELFITGTASATYNDNIFLSNSGAQGVTFFDLIPGLSYEFGKTGALTTGQAAASEDFEVFSADHSRLNNNMFNGAFWLKYADASSSLAFDASYHQTDAAELGLQNLEYLVNRDIYHVDGFGEVELTDKSSIGAGAVFDETHYDSSGFTDWRYVQLPVNYFWKIEPKLDVSAGFQYQDNTVSDNAPGSTEEFFNVGARGEFTPDLTGKFSVGYLREDLDASLDSKAGVRGGLGAESSFTYAVTPLSSILFGVNDDFGYAATGGNYRSVGIFLGAQTSLADQWSVNGQIGYNHYTYLTSPQNDDFYSARVGVSYALNVNVSLAANYTYAYDNSNIASFKFRNNIFSVSGTLHY